VACLQKKTLLQYKTTFNFQIKIKLGNRRSNKKWYPFGIIILFTKNPKIVQSLQTNEHKRDSCKLEVVSNVHYGFTNSHTKKANKPLQIETCEVVKT
jgi:hypothetical protein